MYYYKRKLKKLFRTGQFNKYNKLLLHVRSVYNKLQPKCQAFNLISGSFRSRMSTKCLKYIVQPKIFN